MSANLEAHVDNAHGGYGGTVDADGFAYERFKFVIPKSIVLTDKIFRTASSAAPCVREGLSVHVLHY